MRTILCYGDSHVWGFVPQSFDEKLRLPSRIPKNKRWTGILQHALGEQYNVIEEGLNGRTTNLEEIIPGRPFRNGLKYLPLILESHFPIDLIIFNLGTNDIKTQFARSAQDIAEGMRELVKYVLTSDKGHKEQAPKVLVMVPPSISNVALSQD